MKLYAVAGTVVLLLITSVVVYSPSSEIGGEQATPGAVELRTIDGDSVVAGPDDAGALTVAVPAGATAETAQTGDETGTPLAVTGDGTTAMADEAADPETGESPDSTTPSEDENAPTTTPAAPSGSPGAEVFEPLRNNKAEFSRYENVPSVDLPMDKLTSGGAGTPTPNPISGQFRMHCEYSHFSYDDPIVFPGEPGKSHLHMFFGNTKADAFSTSDSLFDRGGGSCNGYELDRSAYWVPALMQGTTQTIVPYEILLYFKTHSPGSVETFPKGLRVIAGASPSDPDGASRYRWKCENSINRAAGTYEPINDGPFYDTIPDCRALGFETLGIMIDFPFCWDGKNLDSPDHRSHMAYGCSESHPVVFPQLQYIIHYNAPPAGAALHISSDPDECKTGARTDCGFTLHGDWWNAWHEQTNATWINECSRKRVVCQVPAISASTNLVGPGTFDGNPVLQMPAGSYPGAH